jgi:quercetin dioxygenase-like cupin family protein
MDTGSPRAFFRFEDLATEIVEGTVERVIYTSTSLQVIEYHFPPNKRFAAHKHDDNEQMGYVVSGHVEFVVGGEERVLGPGDFYHAIIGVMHGARTLDEPAVLVDVFAPPRKDILEYSNRWLEVQPADEAGV